MTELRDTLKNALKEAMFAKNSEKTSTIRLILAAIKDRDIAARGTDKDGQITNDDILQLLQSMIKQRKDSISMYEKGNRQDLVDIEQAEINIIQSFLPKQMNEEEMKKAINDIITEQNASGMKDMGKVMAALREKYAGQMDFGKASGLIKSILGSK